MSMPCAEPTTCNRCRPARITARKSAIGSREDKPPPTASRSPSFTCEASSSRPTRLSRSVKTAFIGRPPCCALRSSPFANGVSHSYRRHAAVYREDRSDAEARGIGEQKGHCLGDLLGLAEASDRIFGEPLRHRLLARVAAQELTAHCRHADRAGADAVHTNAVLRVLGGHLARQGDDRS